MCTTKYLTLASVFVLLLLLSSVAVACVPTGPVPPTTPEPEREILPPTAEPMYFAGDQVILAGTREQIDRAVQTVTEELGVQLFQERRTEATFSALVEPGQQPDQKEQAPDQQGLNPEDQPSAQLVSARSVDDLSPAVGIEPQLAQPAGSLLAIELYRIVDTRGVREPVTVSDVVDLVRSEAKRDISAPLFADPNYVIGRPPVEVAGDPRCGEGGPAGAPSAGAARELFRDQWAFGPDGIHLYTGTGNSRQRTVIETGRGVRIGVFDTVPFQFPDKGEFFEGLNLSLRHYEVQPDPDLRDHGLFVAGLIREVAPASEIRLFRVLNESARGDLFTLFEALTTFINETLQERGTLRDTVINLSLGVHKPPPETDRDLEDRIESLRTVLQKAHDLGAVIVAAAGNDSGEDLQNPKPPQIPAEYAFVIGVAANNMQGERACFSNTGPDQVAAPGGDGGSGCALMADQCSDFPEFCVISQALYISPETHHAYWNGTSFATPLVSGLVALLLENKRDAVTPLTSTDAIDAIKLGTCSSPDPSLPNGIINLPKTLAGEPCPTPTPTP